MKTKKIKYLISTITFSRLVEGFAVDFSPVRFCVREWSPGSWKCDHYDTGYSFGKPCKSKKIAIAHGIEVLNRNLASGRYSEKIHAYNRGEL